MPTWPGFGDGSLLDECSESDRSDDFSDDDIGPGYLSDELFDDGVATRGAMLYGARALLKDP